MSLSSSAGDRDVTDLVKKVGILQRGRPGKPGNAHAWFQRMEQVLRAAGLYHVVEPKDARELKKLEYLKASVADGKDGEAKMAKINYERLIAEDKVLAILMATVEKDLASSIIGRSAEEAWKSLQPTHMINVLLHGWQQMQEIRVKDHECVVDYVAKMRDNMLILHAHEKGERVFSVPMIVMTTLGQIQSHHLWKQWVADFYSEKMEDIEAGRLTMDILEREVQRREEVLGVGNKQQHNKQDKRAMYVQQEKKAEHKKKIVCFKCEKKGHYARDCKSKRIKLHNQVALMEHKNSNKQSNREKKRKKNEKRIKPKGKIRPCSST